MPLWPYLAAAENLYSRKIVAWAMSPAMPAAGLIVHPAGRAINTSMMKVLRRPVECAQYARDEHQAVLKKHGFVGSMSRKGNCWVDAVMERFRSNLKMARSWQKDHANHAEAPNDIADNIVGFYNALRLHSKLGNTSRNAFERESTSEKSICLSEIT